MYEDMEREDRQQVAYEQLALEVSFEEPPQDEVLDRGESVIDPEEDVRW
jgi:hypothetical protein